MIKKIKTLLARLLTKWLISDTNIKLQKKLLKRRIKRSEKEAYRLALETGKKYYIYGFAGQILVGDKNMVKHSANSWNHRFKKDFHWRSFVIAEVG